MGWAEDYEDYEGENILSGDTIDYVYTKVVKVTEKLI